MAKNKKSEIPHYELLFIVPNKFTIEELKPIVKKVSDIITENGGEITYSEEWGNKKLAYPIKHFTHGYYNLFEFDAEGDNANQVNNILKMDSDVIRHLIISKPKRNLEEIKEEKRVEKERREASKIEDTGKEDKKTIKKSEKNDKATLNQKVKEEKKDTQEVKTVKEETQKEEKDAKKVNLEDLDEKLDKILETNDLL